MQRTKHAAKNITNIEKVSHDVKKVSVDEIMESLTSTDKALQ